MEITVKVVIKTDESSEQEYVTSIDWPLAELLEATVARGKDPAQAIRHLSEMGHAEGPTSDLEMWAALIGGIEICEVCHGRPRQCRLPDGTEIFDTERVGAYEIWTCPHCVLGYHVK